jgi:hypothetical protein
MLFALSSCSEKNSDISPVELIPDGTRSIAVVNLNEIASSNGAQKLVKDNSLTDPARQALSMFIPNDLFQPLATLLSATAQALDTNQAVLFKTTNGYAGLILKVTDSNLFNSDALADYLDKSTSIDGYTVYNINRRVVAISDDVCVIAPDKETVQKVGKNSSDYLSKLQGIKEFLTSDDQQTIKAAAIASDIFGKKMSGLWLCASLRFSDDKAVIDAKAIAPDGTADQIGQRIAQPINSAVVSYIPQGSNLIVASGLQGDNGKLFGIEQILDNIFPGILSLSETGTTLVYARPAGTITAENLLETECWNIANIIEMNQANGEEAVNTFKKMTLNHAQLDPETGCYVMDNASMSMSFGYLGNFFVQAINGQVSQSNNNSYDKDFQGARLVAMLDIPTGSSLQSATELPCGASLTLKVTDENIHAALQFYGNTDPVLATVSNIRLLSQFFPYIIGITTGAL